MTRREPRNSEGGTLWLIYAPLTRRVSSESGYLEELYCCYAIVIKTTETCEHNSYPSSFAAELSVSVLWQCLYKSTPFRVNLTSSIVWNTFPRAIPALWVDKLSKQHLLWVENWHLCTQEIVLCSHKGINAWWLFLCNHGTTYSRFSNPHKDDGEPSCWYKLIRTVISNAIYFIIAWDKFLIVTDFLLRLSTSAVFFQPEASTQNSLF